MQVRIRGTVGSSLRSPAEVEGNEGFPPQPEKDLESPSSTPLAPPLLLMTRLETELLHSSEEHVGSFSLSEQQAHTAKTSCFYKYAFLNVKGLEQFPKVSAAKEPFDDI